MYVIDKRTLHLTPMGIKIKMDFNQSLDKIEIVNGTEILFTGDQGFLTRFSFDTNGKKPLRVTSRPSMFAGKGFWASLELKKTNTQIYT